MRIGIRREDRSIWERRTPITPDCARNLIVRHGIEVLVQASEGRVYGDAAYAEVGARVVGDLSSSPVVFGVKEMPAATFQPGHTYVFFAHVVKGQRFNMPMLRRLMDLGCQLIDYEKVTDDHGRRLIFFGRYAGLAGMVNTLWALGRRLDWEGFANPFSLLRQMREYATLAEAEAAVSRVGERTAAEGLPEAVEPLICGFAGYGNVFRGANQILELLPLVEVEPRDVAGVAARSTVRNAVYRVVFREEHTVEPVSPAAEFDLQHYYDHPAAYRSRFGAYLPHLTLLMNCVYWEARYPRLVTKGDVKALFGEGRPRLRVIGDISCDIGGAIECTVESIDPGEPVYVYEAATGAARDGVAGNGPVIMAVDILPSELPRESSEYFSGVLAAYVPPIAEADYSAPLAKPVLPPEIKRALVVHRGELTPPYRYLAQYLNR